MKSIAAFVPFVEIHARTEATENIQHAVREALILFMRESRAAVGEMYMTAECRQEDLAFDVPSCQRIVSIIGVYEAPTCQDAVWTPHWRELPPTTPGAHHGWWTDETDGGNETLWLGSPYTRKTNLAVRYTWSIKRDDCMVPDWIYEDYADVIAAGALASIHSNPFVDQASPKLAASMQAAMALGIARARNRRVAQMRPGPRRAGVSNFWGG